jgi:DNA primase
MARIPEQTIERIREANDIVDVIGGYLRLTKKGQNYWARCPFHDEKTASFSVTPAKQIFYCFGCHVGGNVITFVRDYEKLSFFEAVKLLADRANIPLEMEQNPGADKSDVTKLAEIHSQAAFLYFKMLQDKNHLAPLDYLLQRGISDETIREFQLGYAPDSWDTLLNEMSRKRVPQNLLELSGLFTKSDSGRFFDRFRNRIMFPIWDLQGRIAGFGGRTLSNDKNEAKYLNSPETPLYHKSRILYGLAQAQKSIRSQQSALIVEGYMDFLQLWQAGFRNVIAGSGTAFTAEHARLISRFAKKTILAYDSDEAGQMAAIKTGFLLLSHSLEVAVMDIPAGEDPDSFLKKRGKEQFQQQIQQAVPFLSFLEKYYAPKALDGRQKSEALQNIIEQVRSFRDPLYQEFFLREISSRFQVTFESLMNELKRGRRSGIEEERIAEPQPKNFKNPADAARFHLLQILLLPEMKYRHIALEFLPPELFEHSLYVRTAKVLYSAFSGNMQIDAPELIDTIADKELRGFLTRLWMESDALVNPDKIFLDCMRLLEEQFIQTELTALQEKMMAAGNEEAAIMELMRQNQELTNKKKELSRIYTPRLFEEVLPESD